MGSATPGPRSRRARHLPPAKRQVCGLLAPRWQAALPDGWVRRRRGAACAAGADRGDARREGAGLAAASLRDGCRLVARALRGEVAAGERHPGTLQPHRYQLDRHLSPARGRPAIAALTVDDVAQLLHQLRRTARSATAHSAGRVSPACVARPRRVCRHVFGLTRFGLVTRATTADACRGRRDRPGTPPTGQVPPVPPARPCNPPRDEAAAPTALTPQRACRAAIDQLERKPLE
jgi:hypothetical protein